jgi:uncharacterized protein YndB with AHSA1/START domain
MQTGTVHFHRVLCAPPERVYRAFLDAGALCKWLPPHGFTGQVHQLDAVVGGGYRMSFTQLATGQQHHFSASFRELVPNRRIVHTDRFDDPGLPGTMTVTIELREIAAGTELRIEQSGIPAVIAVEDCTLGWQQSLSLLSQLVEG